MLGCVGAYCYICPCVSCTYPIWIMPCRAISYHDVQCFTFSLPKTPRQISLAHGCSLALCYSFLFFSLSGFYKLYLFLSPVSFSHIHLALSASLVTLRLLHLCICSFRYAFFAFKTLYPFLGKTSSTHVLWRYLARL